MVFTTDMKALLEKQTAHGFSGIMGIPLPAVFLGQ
jgi:hypothetical protein